MQKKSPPETYGARAGSAPGFDQGERSGIVIGKQETARNLLDMGVLSHEQIARVTGLSLAEVEKLAAGRE